MESWIKRKLEMQKKWWLKFKIVKFVYKKIDSFIAFIAFFHKCISCLFIILDNDSRFKIFERSIAHLSI